MGPLLQRAEQRILHHVFRHLQMTRSEDGYQRGRDPPRLPAEQMLHKLIRGGHRLHHLNAADFDGAETQVRAAAAQIDRLLIARRKQNRLSGISVTPTGSCRPLLAMR
jgi:hypothetical protein